MGASKWLMLSLLVAPTLYFFAPGLFQLGIGLVLIVAKWLIPNEGQPFTIVAAIVSLIINAILGSWIAFGSLSTSNQSTSRTNVLTTRDPEYSGLTNEQ